MNVEVNSNGVNKLIKYNILSDEEMWTPVSEGPPKIDTNVLVTIKDDSGDSLNYYTSVGWYYGGIWVVDNTVCHQVIAWMEFPKPYKDR